MKPKRCWRALIEHTNKPMRVDNYSPKSRFVYQCSFAALSFFLITSLSFKNHHQGLHDGGALESAAAYYSAFSEDIDVETLAVVNEDGFFQNAGVNPASDATTIPNDTQFIRYIVSLRDGDNIESIAKKYSISTHTLQMANNLQPGEPLYDQMALRIPTQGDGVFYVVQPGDTADLISDNYSVSKDSLVAVNGLLAGQEIFIKGSKGPKPKPVEAPLIATTPVPKVNPKQQNRNNAGVGIKVNQQAVPTSPIVAASPTGGWINPVAGSYVFSRKYLSYHRAWDMASRSLPNIVAAKGGTVVTSGWSNGGYGFYVIIDHGDGFQSLYGHMIAQPVVAVGQQVQQGQMLGQMGSTGNSTGPHLHLEVIKDGVRVDPSAYVPA